MVVLSSDQQGNVWLPQKHIRINSLVIVSAENPLPEFTGTTLSMLKIYSRCLIRILKIS